MPSTIPFTSALDSYQLDRGTPSTLRQQRYVILANGREHFLTIVLWAVQYTDGTPTYTPTVPTPRPNYMPWPGQEVVPLGTHHVNSVHASAFSTKEEEATVGLPGVSYAPTVAHVQHEDGDIIAHPPYHDDSQPSYHDDPQPPYHDDSQPLDSAPYPSNMLPPSDSYGHFSELGVAVNTADYQPPAMGGYAQSAYAPDHAPAAHTGPYWTVPSSQVSGVYDAPYDEPLSPTECAVSPSAYDTMQPALETSISAPAVLTSAPPSRPPSALPKVLRVDTVLAATARTLSAPPSAFSSGSAPDSSAPASPVSPSSGPQRERRSGKVPRFKHRPLACHFCRSRKIACGAPADGTPLGRCQYVLPPRRSRAVADVPLQAMRAPQPRVRLPGREPPWVA
jgi:hypothetical protein